MLLCFIKQSALFLQGLFTSHTDFTGLHEPSSLDKAVLFSYFSGATVNVCITLTSHLTVLFIFAIQTMREVITETSVTKFILFIDT
jgi:hypothetical protein